MNLTFFDVESRLLVKLRENYECCYKSDSVAGCLERVHDVCVVCAPQGFEGQTMDHRGVGELGNSAGRVPVPGAREQGWIHGNVAFATQDTPGGHHTVGVRSVCGLLHETVPVMELPLGRTLPPGRGLLHVPGPSQTEDRNDTSSLHCRE
jgi:hypothetical protein